MIHLQVAPEYSDDYTDCYLEGEDAEAVANVITSRLLGAEWEVFLVEDEDENG